MSECHRAGARDPPSHRPLGRELLDARRPAAADSKLDTDFFSGRWAKATDRQRELLWAIAHLDKSGGEFTVQEIVLESKSLQLAQLVNGRSPGPLACRPQARHTRSFWHP